MNTQNVGDVQIIIDKLFEKLDNAKSGGEITQVNHSLRIQINKKINIGGILTDRENYLVMALGKTTVKGSGNRGYLYVLLVVSALAAYVYLKYVNVL